MSARFIHVVRPGLQTTVQDLGRWGWQARGMPVAGPMDPFSHRVANALLGNPRTAATLEIALIGPALEFEHACTVAIAGADFAVTVDGAFVQDAQPFFVHAGSRMIFGERKRGARGYLAVDGGFDTPVVLGSRATHAPSRIGGYEGRSLQKGDRVPIGPAARQKGPVVRNSEHVYDMLNQPATLRALPGPDRDRFERDAFDALQSSPYTIDGNSNRMGYRLRGTTLKHATGGADIISDVTPAGTVQVPASGQPILLMADRQTTGGYSRIATVITADLGVAGQQAPGDTVSFRLCTMAEALSALITRENALLAIEATTS